MFEPKQRLAVAIGASLAAVAAVMFWSLNLALSRIQVLA
jgi:hypothetical protein